MLKNQLNLKALGYGFLMVAAMWAGFFVQQTGFFPGCSGAIIPLNPAGLKGIILSPFLHGSVDHLFGNSVPIFVLFFFLFQFYPFIAKKVLFLGWLLTGFLVWLLPSMNIYSGGFNQICVIGASGIVYVLAFFIFFSGVLRWNTKFLTVSMVVALYYGSLVWGVLPEELFSELAEPSRISWQSHLSGAVVGIGLAIMFRKTGERKKKFIWEFPNYYSEKDDKLWQEYKENHPDDFLELPYQKKENVWERLDELRKNQ